MKKTRERSLLRLFVSSFTLKEGIVVSPAANMFPTNTFFFLIKKRQLASIYNIVFISIQHTVLYNLWLSHLKDIWSYVRQPGTLNKCVYINIVSHNIKVISINHVKVPEQHVSVIPMALFCYVCECVCVSTCTRACICTHTVYACKMFLILSACTYVSAR